MVHSTEILSLQTDSQTAVYQSMHRLAESGFKTLRSFDLKVARAAHMDCTCPYHGLDQCDCQIVVLMVYGQDEAPVSLIIHGHDSQTQISLVETPEYQIQPETIYMIMNCLQGLVSSLEDG